MLDSISKKTFDVLLNYGLPSVAKGVLSLQVRTNHDAVLSTREGLKTHLRIENMLRIAPLQILQSIHLF